MAINESQERSIEKLLTCLNELNETSLSLASLTTNLDPRHAELSELVTECYSLLTKESSQKTLETFVDTFTSSVEQIKCFKIGLDVYNGVLFKALQELNHYMNMLARDIRAEPNGSPSYESCVSLGSEGSGGLIVNIEDMKRKELVKATIVSSEQNHSSFSNIAGLANAKQIIRQSLIMPMVLPNLFAGVSVKPCWRLLLYGPPGTGKTELARAIAVEIQAIFFSVSSSDIVSCMLGESEKFLKELFSFAFNLAQPAVIFIDEIDSLARVRSSTEEEHNRRIKTELLVQLSALERRPASKPPVVFISATNLPWEIDAGILRRFQKRIYIPLPNTLARKALFYTQAQSVSAQLTEIEIDELVDATDGFSASDIVGLTQEAFFQCVAEIEIANRWIFSENRQLWIPDISLNSEAVHCTLSSLPQDCVAARNPTIEDYRRALPFAKSSVNSELIKQFEDFTEKFGVTGE